MQIETAPQIEHNDFDNWIEKLRHEFNDRDRIVYTPDSISKVAGGTAVGTVASVQTPFDGTAYQVPEISATPGFDIVFNFADVKILPERFVFRLYYAGSSSHAVGAEIYNFTSVAYDRYTHFSDQTLGDYIWLEITIPNPINYRGDSASAYPGYVFTRINHISGGNPAHDIYIDYAALVT